MIYAVQVKWASFSSYLAKHNTADKIIEES